MKLFSSVGKHEGEQPFHFRLRRIHRPVWSERKLHELQKELIITIGFTVYACVLAAWMLGGVTTPQTAGADGFPDKGSRTEVARVEPLVYVGEESPVMDKQNDDVLALAIGVDAVISSVPGGELANDITMVMVANTIMNRVESSRYPDTVEEVLCQPQQFSCFAETGIKWVGKAVSDEVFKSRCMAAAERVISGERMLSGAVVNVSSSKVGIIEAQLDGLYFCK